MAPRKDKPENAVGVLEMKLGACLTAPTKRAIADLHHLSYQANVVRNGVARFWERWREDHPDWTPEQRRDRQGNPKVTKTIQAEEGISKKKVIDLLKAEVAEIRANGDIVQKTDGKLIGKQVDSAVLEHPGFSQDLENAMYSAGTKLAPDMACALIAQLRGEVLDRLKTRLPYNHARETGGKCKFRWEGILANEVARDTYRSIHIPVPNNAAIVGYQGHLSRSISKGVNEKVRRMCQSSAVVRFVCFSNKSGRDNLDHVFRIEARQLPKGKRAILYRIATGEWKLCDSKLVYKRNAWFFQMTYRQPQKSLNLNKNNVGTLVMAPYNSKQPFSIDFRTDSGKVLRWELGDGVVLLSEYQRLLLRRRVIQNRYKTASTGRKGHGKQRAFRVMKPLTRRANDLMEVFTNHVVASIIKFCIRFDVGTVIYREPSLILRDYSWFAKNKSGQPIPYNWTTLALKLKHKTWINGIDFDVMRMGCKEHRELFGDNTPSVPESQEQIDEAQPTTTTKEEKKAAV